MNATFAGPATAAAYTLVSPFVAASGLLAPGGWASMRPTESADAVVLLAPLAPTALLLAALARAHWRHAREQSNACAGAAAELAATTDDTASESSSSDDDDADGPRASRAGDMGV